MGLDIFVGGLFESEEGRQEFERDLAALNRVLVAAGVPEHREPADLEPVHYQLWGYSGLHYLRRIAAHLMLRGTVPPPGDQDAHVDPVLTEWWERYSWLAAPRPVEVTLFDHLLLHSDAEGFYLPVAFDTPVVDPEVLGGAAGSSYRLRDECARLARELGVPLDLEPESEEVWDATDSQGDGNGWRAYGIEAFTCIRLHAGACASIRTGGALVFA